MCSTVYFKHIVLSNKSDTNYKLTGSFSSFFLIQSDRVVEEWNGPMLLLRDSPSMRVISRSIILLSTINELLSYRKKRLIWIQDDVIPLSLQSWTSISYWSYVKLFIIHCVFLLNIKIIQIWTNMQNILSLLFWHIWNEKQKIPHCEIISKIKYQNVENGKSISLAQIHTCRLTFLTRYMYFNKKCIIAHSFCERISSIYFCY